MKINFQGSGSFSLISENKTEKEILESIKVGHLLKVYHSDDDKKGVRVVSFYTKTQPNHAKRKP